MAHDHSKATQQLYPKELSSKHRAMMRMQIAGFTVTEISKKLDCTIPRVSIIVNSPLYLEEKAKMQTELDRIFLDAEGTKAQTDLVRVRFREESLACVDKIVSLRDGAQSEVVQLNAAQSILDRAGYKEPEEVRVSGSVEVGDGLANALAVAIKEMRKNGKSEPGGVEGPTEVL